MLPDQVSNPGPLTYESGALLIALRGPATLSLYCNLCTKVQRPIVVTDVCLGVGASDTHYKANYPVRGYFFFYAPATK